VTLRGTRNHRDVSFWHSGANGQLGDGSKNHRWVPGALQFYRRLSQRVFTIQWPSSKLSAMSCIQRLFGIATLIAACGRVDGGTVSTSEGDAAPDSSAAERLKILTAREVADVIALACTAVSIPSSCMAEYPAAPSGWMLDPTTVRVILRDSVVQAYLVPLTSADCRNDDGYYLGSSDAGSVISLCRNICKAKNQLGEQTQAYVNCCSTLQCGL